MFTQWKLRKNLSAIGVGGSMHARHVAYGLAPRRGTIIKH